MGVHALILQPKLFTERRQKFVLSEFVRTWQIFDFQTPLDRLGHSRAEIELAFQNCGYILNHAEAEAFC